MQDYLELEDLIIARIKDKMPKRFKRIESWTDPRSALNQKQRLPGAFIVYDGDNVGANAGDGAGQIFDQRWMVIIAVKNARNTDSGAGARKEAGALILDVNLAMLGWAPSTEYGPFKKATSPRALYTPGFAYFPQMFTSMAALEGDPT